MSLMSPWKIKKAVAKHAGLGQVDDAIGSRAIEEAAIACSVYARADAIPAEDVSTLGIPSSSVQDHPLTLIFEAEARRSMDVWSNVLASDVRCQRSVVMKRKTSLSLDVEVMTMDGSRYRARDYWYVMVQMTWKVDWISSTSRSVSSLAR